MILFWQGIVLGLSLSVLVGPMMFIFVQIGIEKGFRAGAAAGLGTWTSDTMFASAVFFGISYILQVTNIAGFALFTGLIGGVILIVIGLGILLHKPAPPQLKPANQDFGDTYAGLWLKGFLINTFNPFAIFFWIGVMTGYSAQEELKGADALLLFGGIIGTIILTDLLKILLAKRIKPFMKSSYLDHLRMISGLAIILFGLVLIVRVIWDF